MFIVGVVVGPALAILVGELLLQPGQIKTRWALLVVAALLLLIAVMPFFAIELKLGLMFGLPLGLLLAVSPIELTPVEPTIESVSRP